MLKILAVFLTVCFFCHAEVEYNIIPLSSADPTFDLSMLRSHLGPNAKGQTISKVRNTDVRSNFDYYLNDPVGGQTYIMTQQRSPMFLSDSGYVIWYTDSSNGGSSIGYVWSLESDLRTIYPKVSSCEPRSINNLGDVIYWDRQWGDNSPILTVLAPNGEKSFSLGSLNAKDHLEGHDINDFRQIVGNYTEGAFIWDENNGLRDLNLLIPMDSGWGHLSSALYISNEGLIVGYGIYQGQTIKFLLIPVELQ